MKRRLQTLYLGVILDIPTRGFSCSKRFCDANTIPIVTIFEILQRENKTEELFTDGLRPNNAGHQRIFELVRPKLDEILG